MKTVDIYSYFKGHPRYNKLVGNDYLFVEYKCPLEVEQFQLWTESHLIVYVISGKKEWNSSRESYLIEAGDALFVRKGVYSTRQFMEVDYCVMLFFIDDAFIRNFLRENDVAKGISMPDSVEEEMFRIKTNATLESLMQSVFHYLNQDKATPRSLVEIKFKELLFNILLNPGNRKLTGFFRSLLLSDKTELDYIMKRNFQFDLNMGEFARLSGRSLSTFKRDFKNYYGQTPGKWLTDKRLEYAKSLLLKSDMDVNQVCYECGFKNASHFNKIFKDRFSLPPKQYRSQFLP
ncbi:MAG TPA: AraC family transcriptional regulator, partial [Eudoraea sp.]|nr:AraC family transcriptional regulator [Eudoraea sp.]